MTGPESQHASYILPIRARGSEHVVELARYLNGLRHVQVIVVDGSEPEIFAAHAAAFSPSIDHVRPDDDIRGLNGKVRNVIAGLRRAKHDKVVVADDDVRYDPFSLRAVVAALDHAEVVRPQNYFSPMPWHAALDTSRTLINRALDGDWPGTLAFRRSFLPGGYDADALFENLELVRTVRARGGLESVRRDIYIRRLPPTTAHYFSQRVRQAYDEFARPLRLAVALALLPLFATALATRHPEPIGLVVGASIGLASIGLLRGGGYRYFPACAVLAAPLWVLERATCAWLAVYERLRYGGVRYAGTVVRHAASSERELRRRWAV